MAWHCCPRCLIASADDAETPFSERPDFARDGNAWVWTLQVQQPYGFMVRVHGDAVLRLALILAPVEQNVPGDTFTVSWGGTTYERCFVFLNDYPVAALPLASPPVASYVEMGFGWVTPGRRMLGLYVRLYDADGKLLAETRTP
ncbi:MAG: hypothetical protein ACPL7K_04975, partial [Armatimonadota bacterium]